MATYDRTITGGGTVGHPGNIARPYVITSPVYDAVDNTSLAGDDVVKLVDLPADTIVIGGTIEVLEASGNAQITLDVGTSTDVDAFVDGSCIKRYYPAPTLRRDAFSLELLQSVHSSEGY